jgi:hypothetical protein
MRAHYCQKHGPNYTRSFGHRRGTGVRSDAIVRYVHMFRVSVITVTVPTFIFLISVFLSSHSLL